MFTADKTNTLIESSILLTAMLANEISIQTNGELIFSEEDYPTIVKNFQVSITKQIMPLKTKEDMLALSKKYIKELLDNQLSIQGEQNAIAENS